MVITELIFILLVTRMQSQEAIHDIWSDDLYNYKTDYGAIGNPIIDGGTVKYHGPLYQLINYSISKWNVMRRYFSCNIDSQIFVSFSVAYCGTSSPRDDCRLWTDDMTDQNEHVLAGLEGGTRLDTFQNTAIFESAIDAFVPEIWYKGQGLLFDENNYPEGLVPCDQTINYYYQNFYNVHVGSRTAGEIFEIIFRGATYGYDKFIFIYNVKIECQSIPTTFPSKEPTKNPTITPTLNPTLTPTNNPTNQPSHNPTINPTLFPSHNPTLNPTNQPTNTPTIDPSSNPTVYPTKYPTIITKEPTFGPSLSPTSTTKTPTTFPTETPTETPTIFPTETPTALPSQFPTNIIVLNKDSAKLSRTEWLMVILIIFVVIFISVMSRKNVEHENEENQGIQLTQIANKQNTKDTNSDHQNNLEASEEDGCPAEVYVWLDSIGYVRYYNQFVNTGFDSLDMIKEIHNRTDLEDMIGITIPAHQLKIMNNIRKIKEHSEGNKTVYI